MKHSIPFSFVVAGACLAGAPGCEPASNPPTDAESAPAGASPTNEEAPAETANQGASVREPSGQETTARNAGAARDVKPVTAQRDSRAAASLAARPGAAPRLGIGNLKRRTGNDAETTGATVVEASKASSPLLQAASGAARAASESGVTSSKKAPVRENMMEAGADGDSGGN